MIPARHMPPMIVRNSAAAYGSSSALSLSQVISVFCLSLGLLRSKGCAFISFFDSLFFFGKIRSFRTRCSLVFFCALFFFLWVNFSSFDLRTQSHQY